MTHFWELADASIVNHVLHRLDLDAALERAVPHDDARLRLAPAKALGVVVRNLVVRHGPIYAMGEWASAYDPVLLGLDPKDVAALNDDRVGRTLTRLFDADRASLLTSVVLHMVRTFGIDVTQLHNDSTSITVTGIDYPGGGGTSRQQADREADLRPQQGLPPRSSPARVDSQRLSRRCGADRLPGGVGQHCRRRDPRADLGQGFTLLPDRAVRVGRASGPSQCRSPPWPRRAAPPKDS